MISGAPEDTGVIVIGAGFGGICLGIKLKCAGEESFLIANRRTDVFAERGEFINKLLTFKGAAVLCVS